MRTVLIGCAALLLAAPTRAQAPDFYCTATTSTAGCVAQVTTTDPTAQPVSGAHDYAVVATEIQGFKNGLLIYGINGKAVIPISNGTLCMAPPIGRGTIMSSLGSSPLACDGQYQQIINDGGLRGPNLDRGPGTQNWLQFWGRDICAGPPCVLMSDAVVVTYQ